METSLVLIKPDAMQRGLAGTIISRIEKQGLKSVALKMLHLDQALARRHYAIHAGKPFFEDLIEFITSTPIIAIVFQGKDAIEVIRKTWGQLTPLRLNREPSGLSSGPIFSKTSFTAQIR